MTISESKDARIIFAILRGSKYFIHYFPSTLDTTTHMKNTANAIIAANTSMPCHPAIAITPPSNIKTTSEHIPANIKLATFLGNKYFFNEILQFYSIGLLCRRDRDDNILFP